MDHAQQKLTISIPKGIKPKDRKAIATEVIEFIIDRTKSGVGVTETTDKAKHKKLAPYSESYYTSKKFKQKGKSRSRVNLTFDGDMLAAISRLRDKAGKITIGFKDNLQNSKAHGHQTGNIGKMRKFLGIRKADLQKIVGEYDKTEKEEIEEIESKTRVEKL